MLNWRRIFSKQNFFVSIVLILFSCFVPCFATPIFNITTNNTSVTVAANATATITYQVTNNSGANLSRMKYFPPARTTLSEASTCGNSLANGSSCNVVLSLVAPSTPQQFQLSALGVCANGGSVCSASNAANLVHVTVIDLQTFTITPSAGAGGTITPDTPQTVEAGGSQAFTITPSTGFNIQDVLVDGGSVGAVSSYTFTDVQANHTIAASFVGLSAFVPNNGSSNVSVINTATDSVVATIAVGGSPQRVVVAPNGTRAYVTRNPNVTSVINTITNALVTNITVGTAPGGLAILPNSSKVYVTNGGSDTVSVINTANNTVIATRAVGSVPFNAISTPSGNKVYVSNEGGTVSVINTTSDTVVATATVGDFPSFMVCTPNGNKVYVINTGSDNVSVINTATDSVIATIAVGENPAGIAVTPNGAKVYVTNQGSGTVSVINTSTDTVATTINIGVDTAPSGIVITPNGAKAYVGNRGGENTVSVINTSTDAVSATIGIGATPFVLATTADGSKVYIANDLNANVSVINTSTDTLLTTIGVGAGPVDIAIAPAISN